MEKLVKIKIERQGAPVVNTDNAYVKEKGKNIIGICVDLRSKYCEVDAIGTSNNTDGDAIFIGANESSINLKKNIDRDECTKICFPEYDGWNIFTYNITKYTLRICLVKR